MKKFLQIFLVTLSVISCDDGGDKLPEGYEWISKDGRAHFIYVSEEHHGDKISQRNAGKIICSRMFKQEDYCEVYMWSNKKDVPKGFPLINRRTMIGKFEMKNGEMKLKPLQE